MKIEVERYRKKTTFELLPKLFCPNCGSNNTIYREDGEGDYYSGGLHLCIKCNTYHYLDGSCVTADKHDRYTIDQIIGVLNG